MRLLRLLGWGIVGLAVLYAATHRPLMVETGPNAAFCSAGKLWACGVTHGPTESLAIAWGIALLGLLLNALGTPRRSARHVRRRSGDPPPDDDGHPSTR